MSMKRSCKSYFDIVVGLATILSCVITWIGLNQGIHQIANNVSQLFYEIKPVVEKFQEPQLLLRDTIVIIRRDTIVDVHKDTVFIQKMKKKEPGYNLASDTRDNLDNKAREFEEENF